MILIDFPERLLSLSGTNYENSNKNTETVEAANFLSCTGKDYMLY